MPWNVSNTTPNAVTHTHVALFFRVSAVSGFCPCNLMSKVLNPQIVDVYFISKSFNLIEILKHD